MAVTVILLVAGYAAVFSSVPSPFAPKAEWGASGHQNEGVDAEKPELLKDAVFFFLFLLSG